MNTQAASGKDLIGQFHLDGMPVCVCVEGEGSELVH